MSIPSSFTPSKNVEYFHDIGRFGYGKNIVLLSNANWSNYMHGVGINAGIFVLVGLMCVCGIASEVTRTKIVDQLVRSLPSVLHFNVRTAFGLSSARDLQFQACNGAFQSRVRSRMGHRPILASPTAADATLLPLGSLRHMPPPDRPT
jgi:hypothetical protein